MIHRFKKPTSSLQMNIHRYLIVRSSVGRQNEKKKLHNRNEKSSHLVIQQGDVVGVHIIVILLNYGVNARDAYNVHSISYQTK